MAKTFNEMMESLAESVKLSKKGKAVKTFSKKDFEDLYAAFLNETDHTAEVISTKAGEIVRDEVKPVAEFRKMFYNTLIDFGVDKQEAESMLNGTYQFKKAAGSYAFTSEFLEQFLKHKDFAFMPKEDFTAKISIDSVEEVTKDFRIPGTDQTKRKTIKKHRKLKAKSSAPKWAKIDLK